MVVKEKKYRLKTFGTGAVIVAKYFGFGKYPLTVGI